jgi:hypothetical protein
MRYTQSAIAISRRSFVMQGVVRPLPCITPSLLLIPTWNRFAMLPWSIPWLIAWCTATLVIAWQLPETDRKRVSATLSEAGTLALRQGIGEPIPASWSLRISNNPRVRVPSWPPAVFLRPQFVSEISEPATCAAARFSHYFPGPVWHAPHEPAAILGMHRTGTRRWWPQ